MKDWDKDNKQVMLGGMVGIVTMKNGKLKTKKGGTRAGGTGGKWGMSLGATGGILSGGAIAGLTARARSAAVCSIRSWACPIRAKPAWNRI